jgi:hypothetical protein
MAVLGVLILAGLWLLVMRRFGDLLPAAAALAVAAFGDFVLPRVPYSPTVCLARHGSCSGREAWVLGTCILGPLLAAVAIKMLRGDGRGHNGNWHRRIG